MSFRSGLLKVSFALFSLIVATATASFLGACTEKKETEISSTADDASSKAAAAAEAEEESISAAKRASSVKNKITRKVASKESIYVVQVGTFKVESNAKKMTDSLKSTGLPVFQKKIERANGEVFYTVRIEPTPSRVEAEKFAATVKSAVGANSLILSVGQ